MRLELSPNFIKVLVICGAYALCVAAAAYAYTAGPFDLKFTASVSEGIVVVSYGVI